MQESVHVTSMMTNMYLPMLSNTPERRWSEWRPVLFLHYTLSVH